MSILYVLKKEYYHKFWVMSVCVIGAGISWYMSAIKIKLSLPEEDVMIVYQSHPSNTAICWRRFVTRRVWWKKNIDTQWILNVLREKNGFQETRSMRDFVKILEKEMKFWMNLEFPGINKIHYDEDKKWFWPRFWEITPPHCTRWSYFLSWLREITQFLGIKEYSWEVLEIVKHHDNKWDISFVKKILVKTNKGGGGNQSG